MAQTSTYPIACPKCKSQQDEVLYDGIDVGAEPGLRKDLLEHKLNRVTCASCGFSFTVDKNLLYHDSKGEWMIYWSPAPHEETERAVEEFRRVIRDLEGLLPAGETLPPVDLVLSRLELVDRIFTREAELDPAVLEYTKYLIYTRNLDSFLPEIHALLLNGPECTEEQLCFVVQNTQSRELETLLHYQRDSYQSLLELDRQEGEQSIVRQLFPGPYLSARGYLMGEEI